jgi:hypothetical protein
VAGGLYAVLAIAGWISLCALIAWFVGRVLDYAAKVHEDYAREFADADRRVCGDVPAIHPEMRPARRFQAMGGTIAAELSERADTHNTHSVLLSGPLNGTGRL